MTEDTYTHRPGSVEDERQRDRSGGGDDGASAGENPDRPYDGDPDHPGAPVERGTEEWDWRGWVLVGVMTLCFLVIPATIWVLPPVRPFRFAYLVLPLIPALLLGATAVWSAQRSG
ncbi:hypothetical protein M0R88_03445 [Halorussus gelatinilyticus]|uniref:Uncharacterized protein n=1 Tax=Halorussus gelatinilyticus TaxID=2937524 RepID=A0A8U0ILT1_9EURY|nr:hypothetical protein [Halorussus gelatinilyticus]UPW01164.1 hypothetical protein M0R88_03445 [Halorussus gelatinilyticus]